MMVVRVRRCPRLVCPRLAGRRAFVPPLSRGTKGPWTQSSRRRAAGRDSDSLSRSSLLALRLSVLSSSTFRRYILTFLKNGRRPGLVVDERINMGVETPASAHLHRRRKTGSVLTECD